MANHVFGGSWTDEKLQILQHYLEAYRKILGQNPTARKYLRTTYVDAFAGTGSRTLAAEDEILESQLADEEAQDFRKGSARIALELESPFDQYMFIEKNPERAAELRKLKFQYPHLAQSIGVAQSNANAALRSWCASMDRFDRAVVFLDPYGMQVEWSTICALGETKKVDMWLLFPLGVAVNRLLTKNRLPNYGEAKRLTASFGTEEWRDAFYRESPQRSLFSTEPIFIKDTDYDGIAEFFIRRLKTTFFAVSDDYRLLRNSKNVPIYMLCFAAANERGAKSAMSIARYLLKPKR